MNAGASGKIRPHLPDRCVKAQGCELACAISFRDGKGALVTPNKIQETSARELHSFRMSSRTRGVDYVRQVGWPRVTEDGFANFASRQAPLGTDAYHTFRTNPQRRGCRLASDYNRRVGVPK